MARILKVQDDSLKNERDWRASIDQIRRVVISSLWLALAVLTAIGLYGGSQTHRGRLIVSGISVSQNGVSQNEASKNEASNASPTPTNYDAKLKSDNKLFRGNDLFVVSDVSFEPSSTLSSVDPNSLRLDPKSRDGRVAFQASKSFASEESVSAIPVSFRLGANWKKVAPAALVMVILISLLTAVPAFQRLRSDHFLKSRATLNTLSVGCVLVSVAAMIGFNVGFPGWDFGDCHQFLTSVVQGKYLRPSITPDLGRFFPLGLMDNNLLISFGNNPLAYHIERSILLCVVVVTIFLVARRMASVPIACLATLVFLTAPDLFRVYSESIFPEAQLIVWLMLFFLFYHRVANHNGKRAVQVLNVIAVCIFAAAATYCKEPTFGLLLIFSAVQVVFGFARQTVSTKIVHGFLALNAVVFLSLYWLWCSGGQSYAAIRTSGTDVTIISTMLIIFSSYMAMMAVATACFRLWRLIVCKDRDHLFADGALLAGIGYACAYCLLKLSDNYYMTPAHACWAVASASYLAGALPVLLKTQLNSVSHDRNFRLVRLAVGVVVVIVILQGRVTRKCIERQIGLRVAAVELVSLFNKLEREGVRLMVYMPPELQGNARYVQDWRKHTLNVFADFETDQVQRVDSERPFVLADMPEIKQNPGRKLVICPREYEDRFCSRETSEQPWQRVEQYPHVMGAFIYAQNLQVADYSAVAGASDRSRNQTILK